MKDTYFTTKDHCRKGLLKHLERATSLIPKLEDPTILDVGCGTGVPTLFVIEKFGGKMVAADPDAESITFLEEKIKKLNLIDKVTLSNHALFDLPEGDQQFAVVIAEGLLNVIGFREGFPKLVSLTKNNGFIIIHDDCLDQKNKIACIEKHHCKILDSFLLDEQIWWSDFYQCLEKEISGISEKPLLALFESELLEIKAFKKDPSAFKSMYYVMQKN